MSGDALLGRLQRLRAPRGARAAARRRGRRGLGRGRPMVPRPGARTILILAAVLAAIGGGWLWLRQSSLVAVSRVTITGVRGADASQIRSALRAAADNMTTLDVRMSQLRMAVAPYPAVKDLRVSTQFPHGMRIEVIEEVPVGAVVVAGRTIPVAGDGTLLHDVSASSSLPTIPLRVPPGGARITDPAALAAVQLLAAAPARLLRKVSQVTTVAGRGLVAQLRNGPSIYFGDTERLAAKWLAAAAVLSAPGSAGALYINVTAPDEPAAGAVAMGSSATGSSGSSGVGLMGSSGTGVTGSSATGVTGSSGAGVTGSSGAGATSAGGSATGSPNGAGG